MINILRSIIVPLSLFLARYPTLPSCLNWVYYWLEFIFLIKESHKNIVNFSAWRTLCDNGICSFGSYICAFSIRSNALFTRVHMYVLFELRCLCFFFRIAVFPFTRTHGVYACAPTTHAHIARKRWTFNLICAKRNGMTKSSPNEFISSRNLNTKKTKTKERSEVRVYTT